MQVVSPEPRTAPPRRHRRRGAFSLIELVVVISIVAVIGGLAVPRWLRATQHYEVDLAAQRVAADVALAQRRANFSSASVTIAFNAPSANSYQIVGMPDPAHPAQTYTVSLAAGPYNAALGGVNFGGNGGTSLTFDGYGAPKQGGTLTVTVADRQRTLTIDSSSGRVLIQ